MTSMPPTLAERLASLGRNHPLIGRLRRKALASLKGRDGIVLRGPARGLRFNPAQSDSRFLLGNFEPAIQAFLAEFLRPGMVFLDVGANVGFLSLLGAKQVGAAGQVHAFEPLPENAAQIRHNARLNRFQNVSVHEIALSNADTTAAFRVSERPTFGALSDSPIEVDGEIGTIAVPVRRLDGLWQEKSFSKPDLIKLDIEGSEIDFLEGSRQVLEQCRPVLLIELHGTNAGVAERLSEANYRTHVVGGGTIFDAPWAALAMAVPGERADAASLADRLSTRFSGR